VDNFVPRLERFSTTGWAGLHQGPSESSLPVSFEWPTGFKVLGCGRLLQVIGVPPGLEHEFQVGEAVEEGAIQPGPLPDG
jgi:hypothetical protein